MVGNLIFNEGAANALKGLIKAEFPEANVNVWGLRGLCSFYAEQGGMLVGIEC
mgnify:CR=1 FL=1